VPYQTGQWEGIYSVEQEAWAWNAFSGCAICAVSYTGDGLCDWASGPNRPSYIEPALFGLAHNGQWLTFTDSQQRDSMLIEKQQQEFHQA
jgi:hypothetical protein